MGAVTGVTLEGLEDLEETLLAVTPRETAAILRVVSLGIAERIAGRIGARAPKDTGELSQSFFAAQGKQKHNRPSAEVRAKDDVFYWKFVEFGTVRMRARPFIVPTVEAERAPTLSTFREEVGKKVEEAIKRKAKRRR